MTPLEKNLLDLRHSLAITRAASYLGLGVGSGLALYIGAIQIGIPQFASLVITTFFIGFFIRYAIRDFDLCKDIQKQISDEIEGKVTKTSRNLK